VVAEGQQRLVKQLAVLHLFLVVFHIQILNGFQLAEMAALVPQLV
jgi:hypothetical protein